MRRNIRFGLFFGFISILALIVSIGARFNTRFPGDLYLTLHLQAINSPFLLWLMQCVSFVFRDWYSAALVAVIAMFIWRFLGVREAVVMLLAGLINLINAPLKMLINRPRPPADLVKVFAYEPDKSFPSGHAFFAIIVFGMLAYFVSGNIKNRTLKAASLTALVMLTLLIGISRIYLGVHWTSDVLGGYIIGGMFLILLIWIYKVRVDRS